MQQRKKKRRGGLCGVIVAIVVIAIIASIFSSHGNAAPTADDPSATATAQVQEQQWNVAYAATADAATQAALRQPTDTPTAHVQPTHQATPKPTQPAPTCQAVNNNPWCYNFSPGNLITNPPGNFCSYFNCIASFVSADDPDGGYIVECQDTAYSQSGGESGACSQHGGVLRPLYSHAQASGPPPTSTPIPADVSITVVNSQAVFSPSNFSCHALVSCLHIANATGATVDIYLNGKLQSSLPPGDVMDSLFNNAGTDTFTIPAMNPTAQLTVVVS